MANTQDKYKDYSKEELVEELETLKNKKYGLVWDKKNSQEMLDAFVNWENMPENFVPKTFPVLKEVRGKEISTDKTSPTNLLIEGDNYHSLAVLNFTHQNAIDLIYIDPPYNTGNNDFTYNDKYVDRDDPWRHSKWLSFMEKRLSLAKNLLKKEGTIFISIDDNEFAQLKLLCDEIFGEKNFVMDIIWNSRKSVSSDAIVSLNHNHTLLYAKDVESLRNVIRSEHRFKLAINEEKFSNPDSDPRGNWVADPFEAPGVRKNLSYPIKNPNTGELFYPVKGRHWPVLEEEYFELLKDNRIVFGKNGKGKPARKRFLSDATEKGLTPKSIWDDVGTTTNGTQELEDILGEKRFSNPKPVSLLRRIVELGTKDDSIILDFMAGSGTTGHAVLELNKEDKGKRHFILCTNNENNICIEVCYPRIKKVAEGYKSMSGSFVKGLGGNLKYFKTGFVASQPTDKNKRDLVNNSAEMLCIKEGIYDLIANKDLNFHIYKNGGKYLGIIFNEETLDKFISEANKQEGHFAVYCFSYSETPPTKEFEDMKNKYTLQPIPEIILKVYREIFKK